MKTKLLINQEPWANKIQFALVQQDENGSKAVATNVEFQKLGERELISGPSFELRPDEVQELFNRLWEIGMRPKDGTGNSGHVAAIKYHLEDMRKLVFEKQDSNS